MSGIQQLKDRIKAAREAQFSADFDPEKHPRGGYAENKGEFSPIRYRMDTYVKPNEVKDHQKLHNMVEHLRNGGELPPIVRMGDTAFTGSHRIAAYELAHKLHQAGLSGWSQREKKLEIPSHNLSEPDYQRASLAVGEKYLQDVGEWNRIAAAIHHTTDGEISEATKDQIHDDDLYPNEKRRAAALKRMSDEEVAEKWKRRFDSD